MPITPKFADLLRPFRLHNRQRNADLAVVLMAMVLPWSTSLFSIAVVIWWPIALSTVNFRRDIAEAGRPEYFMPMAVFALALAGMLWSEASRADQIGGAAQMLKLLFLPLLIYQYSKGGSGYRVFAAFLASCTALMLLSWAGWLDSRLALRGPPLIGIPVKNYITQAQEFVLCGFGFTVAAFIAWTNGRRPLAAFCIVLTLSFLLNLAFVISSRTALVSIPLLIVVVLAILGARTMRWQALLAVAAAIAIAFASLFLFSTTLRTRITSIPEELARYEAVKNSPSVDESQLTSVGQRLEYWKKSLRFIADAPLYGHGTGSIGDLFEKNRIGKTGAEAITIANPHNQILHATIQWGGLGAMLLVAMWIAHLRVFAGSGIASLIGLVVAAQNIIGSMFNSHLADFVEGWIYVIGVGVAAGMTSQRMRQAPDEPTG